MSCLSPKCSLGAIFTESLEQSQGDPSFPFLGGRSKASLAEIPAEEVLTRSPALHFFDTEVWLLYNFLLRNGR